MFRIALLVTLISTPVIAQQESVAVLVGFHEAVGAQAVAAVESYGGQVTRQFTIVNAVAARLPVRAVAQLRRHPIVRIVELDGEVHALDAELDTAWGVKRIGAGTVHDGGNKGAGVRVAVVDTGVDYNHPELAANYRGGFDCVNNDNDPFDDHYHGTHVAGTVLAVDDDAGVVGIAPEAELYGVKVLNQNGSGSWSQVVCGIEWVVANGMQVTNNSYGGTSYSEILDLAFQAAWNAGVVSIAAAGNSGCCNTVLYPGKFSTVVATAATDSLDRKASFSSTGVEVEIAAPGVGIPSASPGGGYRTLNGTSMASPHVAGTAALILAASPGLTNQEVRDRLTLTADDLGAPGRDSEFGFGIVNAPAAVGDFDRAPEVTISSPSDGARFEPGTVIQFAGAANDPEEGDLTAELAWSSSLDGDIGAGGSFERILSSGLHTVTASVADSGGRIGKQSVSVRVALPNQLPAVTISAPVEGGHYPDGERIHFVGSALDPEDGDISAGLVWLMDQHTRIGTGDSFMALIPVGEHEISAWSTDSEGGVSAAFVNIVVEVIPLTITAIEYKLFPKLGPWTNLGIDIQLSEARSGIILTADLRAQGGSYLTVAGKSNGQGVVKIMLHRIMPGCYVTTVLDIVGGSQKWDGVTPPNNSCEGR